MRRPIRLYLDTTRTSYWYHKDTERYQFLQLVPWIALGALFPYVSVKSYMWLDRLPYWDQRVSFFSHLLQIMRKRKEKMAFDFMLKNFADKELDLLEEFSNY